MTKNLYLPQDRYIAALHRQLSRIQTGLKLAAEDSTAPGNKYTECSWGLCSDETQAWPDAQDHLWPDQFLSRGRVAPLYRQKEQKCPIDTRSLYDLNPNGCFYTCRIFSRGKNPLPSAEQVVVLYRARIAEVEVPDELA